MGEDHSASPARLAGKAVHGIVLLLVGLALYACAASGGDEEALSNQEWTLTSMILNGTEFELEPGITTTIQFHADDRYGGRGGCNSYSGAFRRDGNTISLGPAEATLMACLVGAEQESAFFSAMPQISSFEIVPEGLRLSSADEQTVLIFAAGSDS